MQIVMINWLVNLRRRKRLDKETVNRIHLAINDRFKVQKILVSDRETRSQLISKGLPTNNAEFFNQLISYHINNTREHVRSYGSISIGSFQINSYIDTLITEMFYLYVPFSLIFPIPVFLYSYQSIEKMLQEFMVEMFTDIRESANFFGDEKYYELIKSSLSLKGDKFMLKVAEVMSLNSTVLRQGLLTKGEEKLTTDFFRKVEPLLRRDRSL